MSHIKYSNFVKPSSINENSTTRHRATLSGIEAKRLYLEEIQDNSKLTNQITTKKSCKKTKIDLHISDKELFLAAQNNDVDTLTKVLDSYPGKINTLDNYGWSLLMIACQSNSVESVKQLLHRGIDTSVRDKAGNSARSLVIKNRNLELVDLFLKHNYQEKRNIESKDTSRKKEFKCEICDSEVFPDKDEHLSSTIHNINASKGKKIPASYMLPPSNRGYQIMLKAGWDRDSGLGPDGSGKMYPIKTVQKQDRKGLGNEKRKTAEEKEDTIIRHKHRKLLNKEYDDNRKMEINFRRQFY